MNILMGRRTGADGSGLRHVLLATTAVIFGLTVQTHAFAQSGGGEEEFDIPPSEMTDALQTYSEQADVEIIYAERDVADKVTNGVDGSYSKEAALDEIIDGTDLVYEINEDGVVVIRAAFVETEEASVGKFASREIRVAQVSDGATATDANVSDGDDEEEKRDVIIVTGTHIRGIAPESSPVRTFDREDILNSGVSTAQDFIQTLPQNFGGGSNADIPGGLPNDRNVSFNGSEGPLGSSVNLRGLGSGSTLVLLNGHRLAPSSGIGDFVDISMIPASALERVEVLTDGASSIYGADAVAGVVNFVLRDDFDGAEASFRYGTVTEGDLDEFRASITGGKSWNTGNALFVYEYFNQDNLGAEDRSFSQGALLPRDLLPSQERHSILVAGSQELTPSLVVFGDITYSTRDAERATTSISGSTIRFVPSSENLNISVGATWEVTDAWVADFSSTYSDVHTEADTVSSIINEREVDADLWAVDARASGDLFRLPGGDVKLALGSSYRTENFRNFDVDDDDIEREADRNAYAFFGEVFIPIVGPGNAIPGIERLELNVSGRFEDYSDFGTTSNPKVGVLWSPNSSLNLRGSYSTSFNPPPLGRVGADDRTASVVRTSFFNSLFGFTSGDPSIDDVVVITAFGTSGFLDAENSKAFTAGFDFNEDWGRHELTLNATYFDIEFEGRLGSTPVPDNRSLFDAPNIAIQNPELFPAGSVIFNPSLTEVTSLLDSLTFVNIFPGEDPLNAEILNLVGIVRNLSKTNTSGFDFGAKYTFESGAGEVYLALDGTYLESFEQQSAATTPLIEQVNTLYNPVDLKMRANAGFSRDGFVWNMFVNYTNGYDVDNTVGSSMIESWTTVDMSLSYSSEEKLNNSIFDNMTVRLSVFNLFNEDPPTTPSSPSFGIFGYDPTNASPLNRFIAVELTKAF